MERVGPVNGHEARRRLYAESMPTLHRLNSTMSNKLPVRAYVARSRLLDSLSPRGLLFSDMLFPPTLCVCLFTRTLSYPMVLTLAVQL